MNMVSTKEEFRLAFKTGALFIINNQIKDLKLDETTEAKMMEGLDSEFERWYGEISKLITAMDKEKTYKVEFQKNQFHILVNFLQLIVVGGLEVNGVGNAIPTKEQLYDIWKILLNAVFGK